MDGESLFVDGITKRFGTTTALDRVELSVRQGEFLTILGPSGSGKTTLLKIIAGFEYPDRGDVWLQGRDITFARPAKRNIGMVFQNYALFPHMTVGQNVAFPLRMRGVDRQRRRERVAEALALVELEGYEARMPDQLSGGQQQRVALARAIVFDPPLLLLDEPFGALDRKLREQMQLEVKRLQRRLDLTAVFVTHDQEEALILSDCIAVMHEGVIQQIADPESLYRKPSNRFVADFIGESNLYLGRVEDLSAGSARIALSDGLTFDVPANGVQLEKGDAVHLVIRPERPQPASDEEIAGNLLHGRITESVFLGDSHKYRIATEHGLEMLVRWPLPSDGSGASVGDEVCVNVAPHDIHLVK